MDEVKNFKSFSTTLFASLLVAASYHFDAIKSIFPELQSWMLAGLSGVLGGGLGHWLARILVSSRHLRTLIAGGTTVEGYWSVETRLSEGEARALEKSSAASLIIPGILFLSYDPSVDYFRVHTSRLDASGRLFSTYSEIAHIRRDGTKYRYLNYFKLTYNQSDRFGISHGSIEKRAHDSYNPDQIVAQIFTEDSLPWRQIGTKIPWSAINRYKKQYKNKWIAEYLTDNAASNKQASKAH